MIDRNEASLLVDLYARHLGAIGAQLNEHDMALFLWEGGQVYMHYLGEEQALVCGTKVYKFHREIHHHYFEALCAEASKGRDTGGCKLVLDTESKRILLRRSWTELPSDLEAFCMEIDRLATVGLEWMTKIYGEVVFPIMARERAERKAERPEPSPGNHGA